MLTSSLYLILTAAVTMRSGLSFTTVEAFVAIAIGGACGTVGGMFVVEWVERRLPRGAPISQGPSGLRRDGRLRLTSWLTFHRIVAAMNENRTHWREGGFSQLL
jgi:hypothetical protein